MVIDGPMDGEAFLAYVKKILVPELARGDIIAQECRNYFTAAGYDAN